MKNSLNKNSTAVNIDEVIPHNIDDLFTIVGTQDDEIEKLHSAPYSYWRITFKNLFKNPLVIVCLFLLFLIFIAIIICFIFIYLYRELTFIANLFISA